MISYIDESGHNYTIKCIYYVICEQIEILTNFYFNI